MPAEPFPDGRFETHDPDRPFVTLQSIRYGSTDPRGITAPAFHLYQQRNATGDRGKQFVQGRDAFAAVEQLLSAQHLGLCRFDRQCRCTQAAQVMVVKDHHLPIGRQAYIALDTGTGFNGRAKRREAIFGNARPVQPAMREAGRSGI